MFCNDPLDPLDAVDSLQTFSVNYSINGTYSATAQFADVTCRDFAQVLECDFDLCGRSIELYIDTVLDEMCCSGDPVDPDIVQCYTENPAWVRGLVNSYQRNNTEGCSTVNIVSLYDFLATKPVNTDAFTDTPATNAWNAVATFYGGVPDGNLCITPGVSPNLITGPVEGNNTLAELSLLAQAACSNMFVQVGGCLTLEAWKDNLDPVEFTIPNVISAEPANYAVQNTTAIRMRGGAISTFDCGEQVLNSENRTTKKCAVAGFPSPCVNFKVTGLKGNKEDVENSIVFTDKCIGDNPRGKNNVDDGTFEKQCEFVGGINPNVEECFSVLVKGRVQSQRDEGDAFSFSYGPNNYNATFQNYGAYFQRLIQNQFPVPFFSVGGGAYGNYRFASSAIQPFGQGDGTASFYSDQPSRTQCETIVVDPSLSDCGLSVEDITNKYVTCKQLLYKIGLRRFQELKMAQQTWNVEVPYTPCLKINQMVEFEVPQTSEDCPVTTIKGVIGGINLNNTLTNDVNCTTMKLAVSRVDCLNQTPYTSGNLLPAICGGENSTSPWISSALGISETASASDGCLTIYIEGIGAAWVEYVPNCQFIDPNCTYTLSFDHELIRGFGNFAYSGPGGSVMGGTGNFTTTFAATAPLQTLRWELNPTTNVTLDPLEYKISNISLTLTCLA